MRWAGSVPPSTTAAGSSAGRPAAIRARAISSSRATPMYSTSVPGNAASASQSSALSGLAGSSWPVTSATALAIPALRDGDARVGGRRDPGGHARDDLERDPGLPQRERLLAAAAEHERVPALQPHDGPPGPRPLEHQLLDLRLLGGAAPALLADEHQLRVRAGAVEGAVGDQAVVEDHVGERDQLQRPRRHQPGVSGAGPHQVDAARPRCLAAHTPAISPARASRPRPPPPAADPPSPGPAPAGPRPIRTARRSARPSRRGGRPRPAGEAPPPPPAGPTRRAGCGSRRRARRPAPARPAGSRAWPCR